MELVTLWSEISLLRFAFIEMTGAGRYHLFLHGPFGFRTDGETISSFTGLYQQRGEKAGPKSSLCRSAQSMEAERGGQKPSWNSPLRRANHIKTPEENLLEILVATMAIPVLPWRHRHSA